MTPNSSTNKLGILSRPTSNALQLVPLTMVNASPVVLTNYAIQTTDQL